MIGSPRRRWLFIFITASMPLMGVSLTGCSDTAPVETTDAGSDADADAGSDDAVSADDFQLVECSSVLADHFVTIENNGFEPAQLTVMEGDIVQWEQQDSGTTHTVTSGTPDEPETFFGSGSLSQGDRYCLEFNRAGAFEYYCEQHPQTMRGAQVRVNEPR